VGPPAVLGETMLRNAEIIAVGSELLGVSRLDTNSLWLTDQLNRLGVEVAQKCVVGDDRERLTAEVKLALERTGIVLLSGGLGPTEDDITRDAVAAALGRDLKFSVEICDALEVRFHRFGRKMVEINKRQAYVIDGAEVLVNDRGTAPGQWLVTPAGRIVALLPGPPYELKYVFSTHVEPRFRKLLPVKAIRTLFYRVAGMGESDLDALISPVYKKYQNPVTTILAGAGDLEIHFRARCDTPEEAEALLAEVGPPVEALLGDRLYSRDGASIEETCGLLLRQRGARLCVAESATGGLLGSRVTSVSGSSDYFDGGFLTYSDAMKTSLLGVDAALIREHTAVSQPVAIAMAEGARARTGSTYSLSITGEAGPESGSGQPVGVFYIGLAAAAGSSEARRLQFPGDRTRLRQFATQSALDMLRRRILGLPPASTWAKPN
jgi:nicotinamide-nucleotide amidase